MNKEIETHPFRPFLPTNAKVLMMGTFPPPKNKWCINFYYPNYINDMWRIMGIIFFNDKLHFVDSKNKIFYTDAIIDFFNKIGFALCDTGYQAHRIKGNASDKFLDITTPRDIKALLKIIPECQMILTTGEKAMQIVCEQFNILTVPKIGECITVDLDNRKIDIYRMPSSSRAYPLKLEKKAEIYSLPIKELFKL